MLLVNQTEQSTRAGRKVQAALKRQGIEAQGGTKAATKKNCRCLVGLLQLTGFPSFLASRPGHWQAGRLRSLGITSLTEATEIKWP